MAGTRSALIVATYKHDDKGLAHLRAPQRDADELADVLGNPSIGAYGVTTVLNRSAHKICLAIAEFFADRKVEDVLLLHFSCHGVKDDSGELYFAAKNTRLDLLDPTAVSSTFVRRAMDRTRAGRVVLLLDCCYSGAFGRGMSARVGGEVDIKDRLSGRGRAVIAASSALEYAFEGSDLAQGDVGESHPSVFTEAVVRGLRSGEADRDRDGWVSLDELYSYVHDEVRRVNPRQNPKKWTLDVEGDFHVARRGAPVTDPSELPGAIRESMDSHLWWERKSALEPLWELANGDHPGLALAGSLALLELADDPDDRVKMAARLLVPQDQALELGHRSDDPSATDERKLSERRLRVRVRGLGILLVAILALFFASRSSLLSGDGGRENPETPSHSTSTVPSPASGEVTCWDGETAATAQACPLPAGRSGFASAFPSFDKECRTTTPVPKGRLEVWECRYDYYLIRYSQWNDFNSRMDYFDAANPGATTDPWRIHGNVVGSSWLSYDTSERERQRFQWSATYDDLPYSISVESSTLVGRGQGIGRVSAKPPSVFSLE